MSPGAIPQTMVRLIERFNHLPLWRRELRVWGFRAESPCFDRWLYLILHRLDWMGRDERTIFCNLIKPGMTVLDIGANIGLYTLLLAQLVGEKGRVISFEPDALMFDSLVRNVRADGAGNVETHNVALGSAEETLTLSKSAFNSGDNALSRDVPGPFRRLTPARVVRLDGLLPSLKVDIIKMDIQGWELDALRGMTQTLILNPHVTLLLEFWPQGLRKAGCNPLDLLDFIRSRSMTISILSHGKAHPLKDHRLLLDQPAGRRYVNLIAARS